MKSISGSFHSLDHSLPSGEILCLTLMRQIFKDNYPVPSKGPPFLFLLNISSS